jgi:hypothetical protein
MVIDRVMLTQLFKLVSSILCELCIFPWSEALFQRLLDLYNMCPISSAILCPLIEDLSYIRFYIL